MKSLSSCSLIIDTITKAASKIIEISRFFTFWDGILVSLIGALVLYYLKNRNYLIVRSTCWNIPFALGNVTIQLTDEDRIVAWKLYSQLKTRKAALIFNEEVDVISDVYDSLYEIFPITRELLCNLSLNEINRSNSIISIILRVQNDGLRPHLTKWQSDFRRWWKNACSLPENCILSPQEIQRKYPKYGELVKELKEMNTELNRYAEELLEIAIAVKRKNVKKPKLEPIPPSIAYVIEPKVAISKTVHVDIKQEQISLPGNQN